MTREEQINCTVEALILAAPEPVSVAKLCEVLEDVTPARVRQAVVDLNSVYLGCGNSFRIREVAGGYQVHILPDFEQPIKRLLVKQRSVRLTRAALETLAIIAYKQPVTSTEIEHIRGVASDGVLHNLLERKLIVIAGRAETPGRPLVYRTSNEFLKFFGLNRLSDLPRMEEIEDMIRQAEPSRDQIELPLGEGEPVGPPDRSEMSEESDEADLEAEDMVPHVETESSGTAGDDSRSGQTERFQDNDRFAADDFSGDEERNDADDDDDDRRSWTDSGSVSEVDLDDPDGLTSPRPGIRATVKTNGPGEEDLIRPQTMEEVTEAMNDPDEGDMDSLRPPEEAGSDDAASSDDATQSMKEPAEVGDRHFPDE